MVKRKFLYLLVTRSRFRVNAWSTCTTLAYFERKKYTIAGLFIFYSFCFASFCCYLFSSFVLFFILFLQKKLDFRNGKGIEIGQMRSLDISFKFLWKTYSYSFYITCNIQVIFQSYQNIYKDALMCALAGNNWVVKCFNSLFSLLQYYHVVHFLEDICLCCNWISNF